MIEMIAGGSSLPLDNLTTIKMGNEIIWSSNTGRSASSGKMLGDIVAKKLTLSLEFSWIKDSVLDYIINQIDGTAFQQILLKLDQKTVFSGRAYRSTVEKTMGGFQGGYWYWSSASFDLIQQ